MPLAVRIHEGLVWSNRDKRTLPGKMLGLLDIIAVKASYYLVVDNYYAAGKMAGGLLKQGNHLVSRVKSNAVAFAPAPQKKGKKDPGTAQDLWQEEETQVIVQRSQIDAADRRNGLWRA